MEDHPLCSTMSYPWGTTSGNFHLPTIHKNTLLFSLDKSLSLTNLLYHVLGVNNHFCLAIKINLLQLKKYSHLWQLRSLCALFWGTPPCADVIASFWDMWVKLTAYQADYTGVFLPILVRSHAYLFIFIHGKILLIFLLPLAYPHYVHRQC